MAPSATDTPSGQTPAQSRATAAQFPESSIKAANVSQVKLYSPLRYPGGKTWLIPHIEKWLSESKPKTLIEPFAGGAIVSLTAVIEEWVERAVLVERDPDVAAFWRAALQRGSELAKRVRGFRVTAESVREFEQAASHATDVGGEAHDGCANRQRHSARAPKGAGVPGWDSANARAAWSRGFDRGFRTLVLNRTRRAGILAAGAASIRRGEDDKGIGSRWYPDTLASRLEVIHRHAHRMECHERDSTEMMSDLLRCSGPEVAVFVDPPYTAGGRYPGRRLYTYNKLDHRRLFKLLADQSANVLMTYDASPEIIELVQRFSFEAVRVSTRTANYHDRIELVITRDRLFGKGGGDD